MPSVAPPDPVSSPSSSVLRASFVGDGERTRLKRVHESGSLRLRRPRGADCEGIIVNIGGGIVGGDRLALDMTLGPGAAVTLTTVAAEKVYRSAGPPATIDTRLAVAAGGRLDWLPQETILFETSALRRTTHVDLAQDARFLAAETLVFGRLASAEPSISGAMRDSWRVRRGGRLVFADESRLAGPIGAILDRPALGGGARAVGLILFAAAEADDGVDPLRESLAPFAEASDPVESGAGARDGILVARLLSRSPERLRAAMVAAIAVLRRAPPPRVWA